MGQVAAEQRGELDDLMAGDARSGRQGLLAGAIAAIAALVAMIGLRAITGIVSLLDILADGLLLALPISLFSGMLDLFGKQAKTLLLVGLMAFIVLVGAWAGRMRPSAGSSWPSKMAWSPARSA